MYFISITQKAQSNRQTRSRRRGCSLFCGHTWEYIDYSLRIGFQIKLPGRHNETVAQSVILTVNVSVISSFYIHTEDQGTICAMS